MEREELLAWLKLHLATGVGAIRFRKIIQAFGSAERAIRASISQLEGVENIGRATATRIYDALREIDPEAELESAQQAGVRIITFLDNEYPKLLNTCPDAPALLYVKGTLNSNNELRIAIVGTRRPTRYGSEQAERFAYLLAGAGVTIVSGLARGIDTAAHRGAILAGGKTIAVMGSGFNHIYPPENREFAEQIVNSGGAIITEYPMNIAPSAGNFPARNRIVAGMSLGTLVTEAPKNSGALITAYLALEYNREVFAVPGTIGTGRFDGCNQLIRDSKAKLITTVEDILEEFGQAGEILKERTKDINIRKNTDDIIAANLDESEQSILKFLSTGPADIDTIVSFCQLDVASVCSRLTSMQMKGLIKALPGNQFARRI